MTIIKALFEYFNSCPLMVGKRLNIDYLPADPASGVEYSIDSVPGEEVIKQYRDGGAHCRYPFVISSKEIYGADALQNMCNCGFGEKLSDWLREQSRCRKYPLLPDNLIPRSIKSLGPGYLYFPDINAGNYQIQCELEFYRKGVR